MDPVYVTGHRNPDTDSVVAAMAYAALRNALGDREYEPAIWVLCPMRPKSFWIASVFSRPSGCIMYSPR